MISGKVSQYRLLSTLTPEIHTGQLSVHDSYTDLIQSVSPYSSNQVVRTLNMLISQLTDETF